MPKTEMDYSNTIIYKIVCKDINIKEVYVGYTTNFIKRKYNHKSSCNNSNHRCYNYFIYQFIREHGGWINFDMIEVEKYKAIDRLDAGKQERYWVEQLQATLNKATPTRTNKEYYEDNKEYFKDYYKENKDKIKENSKEYYEDNIDKIKESRKEFYEQNKDKIKEFNKEYWDLNKDKFNEYKREKITCICGTICRKDSIRRHEQTNKHIEFVKTI